MTGCCGSRRAACAAPTTSSTPGQLHPGRPFVPGHETVGVIEEIGARAAERWGVAVGDRVAVEVFQSCRDCGRCLAGDYRHCARNGMADMYGFMRHRRRARRCGAATPPTSTSGPTRCCSRCPTGSTRCSPRCSTRSGAGIRWAVTLPGTKAGRRRRRARPGHPRPGGLRRGEGRRRGFVMVTGAGRARHPRLAAGAPLRRRSRGRRRRARPGRRVARAPPAAAAPTSSST